MKFKKKQKKISVGPNPGIKYVASMVKGETIGFKKMAEMIEKSSTVSRGDIQAVLDLMASTTVWMVEAGHPVRYDGFGIFTPTAKVKAVDNPDDVTTETIGRIGMRFTPTVEIKDKLNNVSKNIDPIDE